MKSKEISFSFILSTLFIFACQSDPEKQKTIASTHPRLEKQLTEDSLEIPAESGKDTALYSRYRITQEEYHADKNYSITEIYKGKIAPLDVASNKEDITHRKTLEAGLRKGINFAGQYTVVSISCGTFCQMHYVINVQNGRILDRIKSRYGASYSPNSRLFTINPTDSIVGKPDCASCIPTIFVLENNKFVKLN